MVSKKTKELNKKAIEKAIKDVRATYSPDKMIIQAVQAFKEEEHLINVEYERLREFYWRYHPEALERVDSVEELSGLIIKGVKRPADTMGYDLSKEELSLMKSYAEGVKEHLKVIGLLEKFINAETIKIAPNTSRIATPLLTARLIALAGGLKELAFMPASTIQLLGAEKALFRHLKRGSRPPKHGIILSHSSVQSAKNKGKAARQLANKLMISLRKDYFGEDG